MTKKKKKRPNLSPTSNWVNRVVADYPWFAELGPNATSADEATLQASNLQSAQFLKFTDAHRREVITKGLAKSTPSDVVICSRWVHSRHVYQFDETLATELTRTDGLDKLPIQMLSQLPYPILSVRAPELTFPVLRKTVIVPEFIAWTDLEPDTKKPCLVIQMHAKKITGGTYLLPLPIFVPLTDGTCINPHLCRPLANSVFSIYLQTDEFHHTLIQMIQLLLYICSKEADIQPAKGSPTEICPQTPISQEIKYDVGVRIGRKLGETRKRGKGSARVGKAGAVIEPYMRRAHWHHYWVGQRKGRTDGKFGDHLELKWLSPIFVGMGDVSEVVHKAS